MTQSSIQSMKNRKEQKENKREDKKREKKGYNREAIRNNKREVF